MPDPAPFTDADRAELVAYLDGELDRTGQQRVEARLGRDVRARAEAETLKRAWELLDYLPRPEPSPNFTERTLTRISALPRYGLGDDGRAPTGRVTDPVRRGRLQEYLAAYHGLSPERRADVHQLDYELHVEDPMTKARLAEVMERYAGWLSRLAETDFR